MSKYYAYTDGSSRGNPGAGGWGMIVMNEENSEIIFLESSSEDNVTNNRMELKAMICALGYAESHPNDQFIIFSDSAYVVNSCNSWMRGWAANGWRNSKKQTVENVDLMQAIWSYISRDFPNFEIRKCSGHAGDLGNELADAAATRNWKKYKDLVNFYEIQEPIKAPNGVWEYDFKQELRRDDNWFPID